MKNQRKIDLIVVHCSATRINQDFPVEALEACHKARGSTPSVTTITLRRMAWSIPAVQKAKRVLTPATTTPIASESATRVVSTRKASLPILALQPRRNLWKTSSTVSPSTIPVPRS